MSGYSRLDAQPRARVIIDGEYGPFECGGPFWMVIDAIRAEIDRGVYMYDRWLGIEQTRGEWTAMKIWEWRGLL